MGSGKRSKSKRKATGARLIEPSESPDTVNGKIRRILTHRVFAAALLFLVSFSVFIPSLRNSLVWDDITYVQKWAPILKSAPLDFRRFVPSRTEKEKKNKYFRPVYTASLIMDSRIWGISPFGFHMTNVILHSVSTVLVFLLILLLLREFRAERGEAVAFLGAMLFALFPLHVESVSFIAARGDLLAAMFLMLCLIFYILSYRRFLFIVLAGICFYLSFLSKEVAFAFPIIILGFDLISRRFLNRANILKYVIIAFLVMFYFYIRSGSVINVSSLLSEGGFREAGVIPSFGGLITLFLGTYLFYAEKLLFPYNLNHFIGTISGGDAWHIIISLLLVVAVAAVFVVSIRKKENFTAFSLLWIFATLGPAVMIALYPLAITRFAERFVYVPSAGYCMLVGYLLVRVGSLIEKKWLSWAIGGFFCVSYLIVTVRGQEIWKDEITFWEATIRKSPDQIVPKINYGEALRKSGRIDEAINQFLTALGPGISSTNRGKATIEHYLAVAYIDKGDYTSAEKALRAELHYNPALEKEYYSIMGFIAFKKDDPEDAEKYLHKALEIDPGYANAHFLLGFVYFNEALRDNSVYNYGLAESSLKNALKYDPTFAKANMLLAKLYLALGNKEKARYQAEAALQYTSDSEIISDARSILNAIKAN